MTARLWHLTRSEARAHRGALCLWLALLAWVATGSIVRILIEKNFTWEEQRKLEGTFLDHLAIWNFNNIAAVDSWLWLGAGLLSAWIWLADPLQSPNAFWATRPVRLRELVAARALLCGTVLVLLPAALAIATALAGGFSLRDTGLSALSFALVKAGLVPLGFLVGMFLPAPGCRCAALLPALGWWIGLISWRLIKETDADFRDHSGTFVVLWCAVPLALLALPQFRRQLIPQGVFALFAFALVWIAGSLKHRTEQPSRQTAQAVGYAALRISGAAHNFELLSGRSTDAQVAVKIKLRVDGLPADVAAEITATQLVMTPGTAAPTPWPQWQNHSLVMDTYYSALAHAMSIPSADFPGAWRNEEEGATVALPAATFDQWKDDQSATVTGAIRLRLLKVRQYWKGIYHKSQSERPGGFHLHQSVAVIRNHGGDVRWMRPWMAGCVAEGDTSEQGILFNPQRSMWVLAFQPPQRLADGTFTREITRQPPQWAIGKYQGGSYSWQSGGWEDSMSSSTQIENHDPEFLEITAEHSGGLDGLPAALIGTTVVADLEAPLEPVTLTKKQILDTRKISPAQP